MNKSTHTPIFLREISALLQEKKLHTVIDGTFGEGGHGISLAKLGHEVLGIEWSKLMFTLSSKKLSELKLPNLRLVQGNYATINTLAKEANFVPVDAIIFDLGLSLYQLYYSQQGFSLKRDEPLDLRINEDLPLTAAQFLNTAQKAELLATIGKLAEDRVSGQIVIQIEIYRRKRTFRSIEDLRLALDSLAKTTQQKNKLMRKVLQALRIVVNDEFNNITNSFTNSLSILKPGGLLIYLTYHSLEDRLVKRLGIANQNSVVEYQKSIINKEYQFATSAKLRIYEKRNS